MNDTGSVSQLLLDLKNGDHDAAQALWNRTVERIAAAARKRLAALGVRGLDEDDVAVDVFASLCLGAGQGRFPRLDDRNDLWQVLMMLTRQKVVDQRRRQQPEWTESALPRGGHDQSEVQGIDLVQGDVFTKNWFNSDWSNFEGQLASYVQSTIADQERVKTTVAATGRLQDG